MTTSALSINRKNARPMLTGPVSALIVGTRVMVEGDELEVGKIVGRRTVDGVEMGIAEYTHYYPAAAIGTKTFGNDPQDDEGLWMQYGRQTHAPVANITQPVDHHGMSDAEWAEHVLSM